MLTGFSNPAPRICRLGMMPGPYIPERSEDRIGRIHLSYVAYSGHDIMPSVTDFGHWAGQVNAVGRSSCMRKICTVFAA